MYGYIYLILNKVNGKTYIGQHKSSKEWFEDNYMGSGKNIRRAQNHKGKNNTRYGKKWTDEQKKKLSESHKGQTPWNKGIKRTDLADTAMVYENPKTGERKTRQEWSLSGVDVYYRKFIKIGRLRGLD